MLAASRFVAAGIRPALAQPAGRAAFPSLINLTTTLPTDLDFQVRQRSNRSRRGLYDGKDIRTGNNVSFSMKATKRTFKPNVFKKRVFSEILDAMIPFHLTASTLRSIDKAGGLDNYLMTSKHVKEGEGFEIKRKILQRVKNQERWERKKAEVVATDHDLNLTRSISS
jgi:large subunit ribosomal protein L28